MLVAAAVMGAIVVGVGDRLVDRAKAQTAADAAALAGVSGGRSAAQRFALSNGGILRSFEAAGALVQVRVAVGRAEATARAERR